MFKYSCIFLVFAVVAGCGDKKILDAKIKGETVRKAAADFASAEVHSFTFSTQHADVAGLDNVEQDDVRIRFMINDGADDSPLPVTSENFRVDNYPPFAPTWP